MNGVINVLKPPGMTSSDIVVFLRRHLKINKAGHTGTLDPDAAGVLPVCLGKATKISDFIQQGRKTYICELRLGIATDTSDLSGEVVYRDKNIPDLDAIASALSRFMGEIEQVPPMHSAIKLGGKQLYKYARQGIKVDIPPRKVYIYDIGLISCKAPDSIMFRVECSKGTYIRSLCRDLGEHLGCGGVMAFLLRERTGNFSITDSYTLDEILDAFRHNTLKNIIIPTEEVLAQAMPAIIVKPECLERLKNGNRVKADNIMKGSSVGPGEGCRIYCGDIFVGIGSWYTENNYGYVRIKTLLL